MKQLYFAFINPYLQYGNIAWASTHKSKISKINRLQKRAVRLITNSHRLSHSRPLIISNRILNVFEINLFQLMTIMFRHKKQLLPEIFSNKFAPASNRYSTRLTRHGYREKTPPSQLNKFSITTRGPYVWNRMTCKEAKVSHTLQSFKKQIKSYLLSSPDTIKLY